MRDDRCKKGEEERLVECALSSHIRGVAVWPVCADRHIAREESAAPKTGERGKVDS